MGCGNSNKIKAPNVTPITPPHPPAPQPNSNFPLPPSQPQPMPNPQRPGPIPNPQRPGPMPNPQHPGPMPESSPQRPPPYSFPLNYERDSIFQLQVKDLTGAVDFSLDLQPKLTGRELFQLIGAEMKKLGEQREFQVVLYGRAIKCDEEEIGKSGLSVKGVAYCIYKPSN